MLSNPAAAATGPDANRRQVRPQAEGWTQQTTEDGRPLLQFKQPRVAQPKTHLADLTLAERQERVREMGLPAFRAKQLSTHYFSRLVDDPAQMTDLPATQRDDRGSQGTRGAHRATPCRGRVRRPGRAARGPGARRARHAASETSRAPHLVGPA